MEFSRSIIEIIKERSSRRSYTPQPVEAEKLQALRDFFVALKGPIGGEARFVILDTTGAETLLGRGDMLFLNPESGSPARAQGVMITDMEIERIIAHWQKNAEEKDATPPWEKLLSEPDENEDEGLIEQAVTIVRQSQRASASLLQRRLRIGYPRAARLLDQLEEMGVVGPSQGGGKERDVLVGPLDEELGDSGKSSTLP